MPSFRVTLAIGALREGVAPAAVVPAAAAATAELTTVEASELGVVRGSARVTVRFTAEGDSEAATIARHVAEAMEDTASVISRSVTRRVGGRWYPLAGA